MINKNKMAKFAIIPTSKSKAKTLFWSVFMAGLFFFFLAPKAVVCADWPDGSMCTKDLCVDRSCRTFACDCTFDCSDACGDCSAADLPGTCQDANCTTGSCGAANTGCPGGVARVDCTCTNPPGISWTAYECCEGGGGGGVVVTLAGHIFNDQNNNGVYSFSEPHIAGVPVKVFKKDRRGNWVVVSDCTPGSTKCETNSSGETRPDFPNYFFGWHSEYSSPPGPNSKVVVYPPSGWECTTTCERDISQLGWFYPYGSYMEQNFGLRPIAPTPTPRPPTPTNTPVPPTPIPVCQAPNTTIQIEGAAPLASYNQNSVSVNFAASRTQGLGIGSINYQVDTNNWQSKIGSGDAQIRNPSFENGSNGSPPTNWSRNSTSSSPNSVVHKVGTEGGINPHTGDSMVKVELGNDWGAYGIEAIQSFSNLRNTQVTVCGWVYIRNQGSGSPQNWPPIRGMVLAHWDPNHYIEFGRVEVTQLGSWQRACMENITIPNDPRYDSTYLQLRNRSRNSTIYYLV